MKAFLFLAGVGLLLFAVFAPPGVDNQTRFGAAVMGFVGLSLAIALGVGEAFRKNGGDR